jgi:hypothetical protein
LGGNGGLFALPDHRDIKGNREWVEKKWKVGYSCKFFLRSGMFISMSKFQVCVFKNAPGRGHPLADFYCDPIR